MRLTCSAPWLYIFWADSAAFWACWPADDDDEDEEDEDELELKRRAAADRCVRTAARTEDMAERIFSRLSTGRGGLKRYLVDDW